MLRLGQSVEGKTPLVFVSPMLDGIQPLVVLKTDQAGVPQGIEDGMLRHPVHLEVDHLNPMERGDGIWM